MRLAAWHRIVASERTFQPVMNQLNAVMGSYVRSCREFRTRWRDGLQNAFELMVMTWLGANGTDTELLGEMTPTEMDPSDRLSDHVEGALPCLDELEKEVRYDPTGRPAAG